MKTVRNNDPKIAKDAGGISRCNLHDCYFRLYMKNKIRAKKEGKNSEDFDDDDDFECLETKETTPEDVLNIVCQAAGVSPQDIKERNRGHKSLIPRQVYCFLASEMATIASGREIADLIHRERTTFISAVNKCKDMISIKDKAYVNLYNKARSLYFARIVDK